MSIKDDQEDDDDFHPIEDVAGGLTKNVETSPADVEELDSAVHQLSLKDPLPEVSNQEANEIQRQFGQMSLLEECVLCREKSIIFGVGECLHPACMECLIRMRCLGEFFKCYACRKTIQTVYFVNKPEVWDDYSIPENCLTSHLDCEKFQIAFESQYVMNEYAKLNAFVCQECKAFRQQANFPDFDTLQEHMLCQHDLVYCTICLDHLNILPKKRQTFKDFELMLHMTGDLVKEDDSIRGHPKCLFCDQRFFDDTELYKHSKKDHYFCQVCTSSNEFFKTLDMLHKHYRQMHHPCLDPDCVSAGIVFNDLFALDSHMKSKHNVKNRSVSSSLPISDQQSFPSLISAYPTRNNWQTGDVNSFGRNSQRASSASDFPSLGSAAALNDSSDHGIHPPTSAWNRESAHNLFTRPRRPPEVVKTAPVPKAPPPKPPAKPKTSRKRNKGKNPPAKPKKAFFEPKPKESNKEPRKPKEKASILKKNLFDSLADL